MHFATDEIPGKSPSYPNYFWRLLPGVWVILSLFMASQLVGRTAGAEHPVGWYNAILLELLYCTQWMALAPVTLWLARMFPLQSKKIVFGIVAHLVAGTLMSGITMAGRTILNWIFLHHMLTALTWAKVAANMTEAMDYGIMSYLLNTLFCYSYEFYIQIREREIRAIKLESELEKAQLSALKMQLHPHFFFNTLNTISVLIRKEENELAVDMIARLSKFFRYTLEKTNIQEISLSEELNAIDLYLEIQKVRFQDKLTLKRSISPETLNAQVPTLILQPLVENALLHGISNREEGGTLELSAERLNGAIHLRISDNGPGMQEPKRAMELKGIGLQNTKSRLQKLYGSSHQFEVISPPEGGTMVHVAIPYREEHGESPNRISS